ncbi:MAG TPA: tetratricopeptide repeat-containing diguanylate cyclase [Mycobacteriales bacterium]|nr:tetratricopeptide repeat-containing diguanylate cyclase [Mycobacteriales bacterium]
MKQLAGSLAEALSDTRDEAARVMVAAVWARHLASVGRLADAEEAAGQARRFAEFAGDHRSRALALHACGMVSFRHDDHRAAFERFSTALEHAEEAGDLRLQALVSVATGLVQAHLADPIAAIDRMVRALTLAEQAGGDSEVECEAYLGLARLYGRLDEPDRATRFAERALDLARVREDTAAEAAALRNLGNVHAGELERLGSLGLPGDEVGAKAIAWYDQARPLVRGLGDRIAEVTLVNNTAHVLRFVGAERQAIARIEDVLAGGTDDLNPVLVGLLYYNLGDSWLRLGEPGTALRWLREGLRLVLEHRSFEHVPKMHLALADAYERTGDTAAALEQHKAYHEVERKVRGSEVHTRALFAAMMMEQAEVDRESTRIRREHHELVCEFDELSNRAKALGHQVRRDALTGLPNRLAFDEWLADIVNRTDRAPVSVALLDLDRFKLVNDGFSHLVGDEVLRRVGRLMAAVVRHGDLVGRYGGEEFGMVMPATSLAEAAAVCERVRRAVANTDWSGVRIGLSVTISGGVAQESSSERALSVADRRLYTAKHAGRNRIVAY